MGTTWVVLVCGTIIVVLDTPPDCSVQVKGELVFTALTPEVLTVGVAVLGTTWLLLVNCFLCRSDAMVAFDWVGLGLVSG